MPQNPKSCTIIGLVFTGEKGFEFSFAALLDVPVDQSRAKDLRLRFLE